MFAVHHKFCFPSTSKMNTDVQNVHLTVIIITILTRLFIVNIKINVSNPLNEQPIDKECFSKFYIYGNCTLHRATPQIWD